MRGRLKASILVLYSLSEMNIAEILDQPKVLSKELFWEKVLLKELSANPQNRKISIFVFYRSCVYSLLLFAIWVPYSKQFPPLGYLKKQILDAQ